MIPRSTALAAATVALAALVPASAQAATRVVDMGVPLKYQKTFQKLNADVDNFFPQGVTINVGDSVRFVPSGFHTIDLPAKGQQPLGLITPSGQTVSGLNDAAGNPFWFNGQPALGFNPALLKFAFGKTLAFTGAKRVESGLPVQNHPKPVTVKFTKAGSFTYFCDIHRGMKGTVRVVAARRKIPSAAAVAAIVKRQANADLKTATKLQRTQVPAATVSIGAAGPGGVESFAFYPGNLTISAGTTVHFTMPTGTRETHTATFGPGDPNKEPQSYLGQLAASFDGPAPAPAAAYPSDPPGNPATVNANSHGNGFWNSGALDQSTRTPQPAANSATFDTPGTYQVYCLIHPFMHGTITVR